MKTRNFALSALSLFAAAASLRASPADCDRDCLRGFLSTYLEALAAHNPAALPVAKKVRFTEDSVEIHLGDGLWKTASRIRPYRQDVLDTRAGEPVPSSTTTSVAAMPARVSRTSWR